MADARQKTELSVPNATAAATAAAADVSDSALYALITADPALSPASKKQYLTQLRLLARDAGGKKSLAWVLRHAREAMNGVIARFQASRKAPPSDQTISAFCSSAYGLLKRLSAAQRARLGGDAFLREQWDRCSAEPMKRIREKYDNWRASDRQKLNFVPWEDLIAKREELAADPRTFARKEHLLLSWLTYLPPMRTSDYCSLRLYDACAGAGAGAKTGRTRRRTRFPQKAWDAADQNYVLMFAHRGCLTVNEYKTAAHYRRSEAYDASPYRADVRLEDGASEQKHSVGGGRRAAPRQVVHVPRTVWAGPMEIPPGTYDDKRAKRTGRLPSGLFRVMRASADAHPRAHVFVDETGHAYEPSTFNTVALRILRGLFPGKALTFDLVRHAAATWLDEHYRHNIPVLTYFRYWMMHSRDMQSEYVLANGMEGVTVSSSSTT